MKLMNEVQSDFDGVVKDIMVKDGSPVEFDQPIMVIE
jgi:acetyl-CoA carboxylase biotin carboxyl carrier protein